MEVFAFLGWTSLRTGTMDSIVFKNNWNSKYKKKVLQFFEISGRITTSRSSQHCQPTADLLDIIGFLDDRYSTPIEQSISPPNPVRIILNFYDGQISIIG